MTIDNHAEEFAGKKVKIYDVEKGMVNAAKIVYRLTLSYDDQDEEKKFADLFSHYLSYPLIGEIDSLIIGCWDFALEGGDSVSCVEQLVAASEKLTGLRHLFFGDIICEESEMSWIQNSDMSAVINAYPQLEELRIRGGNGLSLGRVNHDKLKKLAIETGGMDVSIVREVSAATLPQLEHLELWLGTEEYGASATVEDLEPILSGKAFPDLKYLGLRNSHIADDVAIAVAASPVLDQLETLDLSLGVLTDKGAEALLNSGRLGGLETLDLHHHFLSKEMSQKLQALDIEVNTDDKQEDDVYDDKVYRYVAVGE